ncbi:MAG: hypothetical protein IPM17_18920 [Verrucomicrobia bacterium]|jgi:nucleoside-triphosphatase THEP1|nr:hypothetical protein [Verrucomicrobiota bacterium]
MTGDLQSRPRLRLVTGARDAGKTRWCERAVADLRAAGHEVRGLLSPGVFEAGRKVAIRVRDLRSGEERLLATRRPEAGAGPSRSWEFDEAVLTWADARLQETGRCHTLVVDELGPMELQANRGWTSVWSVLRERAFTQAILAVRPALLAVLRDQVARLGGFEIETVRVSEGKDGNDHPGR